MSTRELAIQLGICERINVRNPCGLVGEQQFKYLFVLDFESTCWEVKEAKSPPEVIEFAIVLYDVMRAKIIDEFQQYVTPSESPRLSEFCKNLTGIRQTQVDHGVPIATCLMLCMRWMKKHVDKLHLKFSNSRDTEQGVKCMFVTWTDWDLGVCLKNECKRKGIRLPVEFRQWADLKELYKDHYKRSPKGLLGALSEVGLSFEGKEHCGLHDARNTAKLAGKMIASGIPLRLTKT